MESKEELARLEQYIIRDTDLSLKLMNQSSLIALLLIINLLSCLAMYTVGYVVAVKRFQQEAIRNRHAELDSTTGEWRWTQN